MDKRLTWQGEAPPVGPALFDEKARTYNWRVFKRGATWGAGLTFFASSQFALFTSLIEPGKRPFKELLAIPFTFSFLAFMAFGTYECVTNKQVIHQPALDRAAAFKKQQQQQQKQQPKKDDQQKK